MLIRGHAIKRAGMGNPTGKADKAVARAGQRRENCTICRHPERARIEHLMACAVPARRIAEEFGITRSYNP
jgi:hypothetical protein